MSTDLLWLAGIKAITFDCYGTLIDWETGILSALRPWLTRYGATPSDHDVLEGFARIESQCEAARPADRYPEILRAVHGELGRFFNLASTPDDAERFSQSVGDWPAFADTAPALQRLKRRYKLVIVSNVDRASFARTNARLGVEFDAIVTAEDVGAYKPDVRMFERAFSELGAMGVKRGEILHAAESLFHDHVPAKQLGLRSAWVYRRADKAGFGATRPPGAEVHPDLTVTSMKELADRLIGG